MFKILLAFLLLLPSISQASWRNGTGEQTILGTSNAALIGYNSYNSIVQPLDNLLATYCNQYLIYTSSSTLTVSAGSVMVSNSQGTIRLMLLNTATTAITSANIDTGSLTASTTYYVYAVAATTSSTAATYYFSASNSAPSGQTYYYQIGSFTTDSSNQITGITNSYSSTSYVGTGVSKSNNVIYQALVDTFVWSSSSSGAIAINTNSSNSLSGATGPACSAYITNECSVSIMVRKGDYYECTGNSLCVAIPTSK